MIINKKKYGKNATHQQEICSCTCNTMVIKLKNVCTFAVMKYEVEYLSKYILSWMLILSCTFR